MTMTIERWLKVTRPRVRACALLGLMTLLVAHGAAHGVASGQQASGTQHEPRTRVIMQSREPLASRLLPDDEVVVVESWNPPPLTVVYRFKPDIKPSKAIEFASQHAVAAVVMDVERSAGVLVKNGSWIDTSTTGTIVDVVREDRTLPLSVGGQLTLWDDGGETLIGGKIVRAGPRYFKAFQPGHRYLVFLFGDSEKPVGRPTGRWEVLTDGTLQDTSLGEKGSDWRQAITGLSLDVVVDTMRKLERKHKAR
jgi:hypothetical protein